MELNWDIKFDGNSIADKIQSFQLRVSSGGYARELTIYPADPSLFDPFVYTTVPQLKLELLTYVNGTWRSQGHFHIERPIITSNPDGSLLPGIWGRSKTAILGPPFAKKIYKSWQEDTTCLDILNEIILPVGISFDFNIDNYTIYANTYTADGLYPIEIVQELATFIGAHINSTADDRLVINYDKYHFLTEDHTFTDNEIAAISRNVSYPEFGNRIRIGALGASSGFQITVEPLDDDDCLPADGTSTGTLLAFVTDFKGEAVPDNILVDWTAESGVTLQEVQTSTTKVLLSNRQHKASDYYHVTVDYPIYKIIGIWAYGDGSKKKNYWDEENLGCSFSDRTITVYNPFDYCDQTLRIDYITSGCAVNKVTAGLSPKNVKVTAEVEGSTGDVIVKLGNTCECGSDLNMKVTPSDSICLGKSTRILVWATVNNKPAIRKSVKLRITKGCGELTSENKLLSIVKILNEAAYVSNDIQGVSQVKTEIISNTDIENPKVYLATDTNKTNDLFSSVDGKVIDLNTVLETGTKVIVDHYVSGAALVSWQAVGSLKDCEAEITAYMEDGTETGLTTTVNVSARDCTIASPSDPIPDHDTEFDFSLNDPDEDDWSDDDEEGEGDDSDLTDCEKDIQRAEAHPDDGSYRFGAHSHEDCPGDGSAFPCTCQDMCNAEIHKHGRTLDYERTIHEMVVDEGYVKGTSDYNERFGEIQQQQMNDCMQNCEDQRDDICNSCDLVSGPEVMSPGETAEFVCGDGTVSLYTMPEGACGTQTVNVGCCEVKVRSTAGQWVTYPVDECLGVGFFGGCYDRSLGKKFYYRIWSISYCTQHCDWENYPEEYGCYDNWCSRCLQYKGRCGFKLPDCNDTLWTTPYFQFIYSLGCNCGNICNYSTWECV